MAHSELIQASRLAGEGLLRGKESALLTDAAVGAGDTLDTMKAAVIAAAGHADIQPLRARVNQALDLGGTIGDFSTANIQAASTLVGLAGNTQTDTSRVWGGPVPE